MILSLDQMQHLAASCAPSVAAETLISVAKVESGFDPLAINVNGGFLAPEQPTENATAVERASALIAEGRSVDLGLSQINSRNLGWLQLSVEDAFDPCLNVSAAARVLQAGYGRAVRQGKGEQSALLAALSYYNTGDLRRGLRNGYVAKVTKAAASIAPALRVPAPAGAAEPAPSLASWDVFGRAAGASSFVIDLSSTHSSGEKE